ncbi:hypothetical protein ACFLUH_00715 [Chloroflexota bacterium]
MEAVTGYLRGMGVEAVVTEEALKDVFVAVASELVIQLKGRSIDKIRLTSPDYMSCTTVSRIYRFQYEINLDKKLSREANRQINANTKTIRENKKLGLFGGKVAAINWIGGELADILNRDTDVLETLLDCTNLLGDPGFRVSVKDPSTVVILGPRFVETRMITELFRSGLKEQQRECVFGFNICDRIAKRVKDLVNSL